MHHEGSLKRVQGKQKWFLKKLEDFNLTFSHNNEEIEVKHELLRELNYDIDEQRNIVAERTPLINEE
ncbi:Hypothetical predicted protein [Octopus vulgaris]|uniref:Uncharacterized protein n=1 Tax=Octopus vulgaris TaxID=6645 RepID=A0AA36BC75_OCTVU|nr:Hypothetical predicted protein [Octopus vulgaris]